MGMNVESGFHESFGRTITRINSELKISDKELERKILYRFMEFEEPIQNILPYNIYDEVYGKLASKLNKRYVGIVTDLIKKGDIIESEEGYELSNMKRRDIENSDLYNVHKQMEGLTSTKPL